MKCRGCNQWEFVRGVAMNNFLQDDKGKWRCYDCLYDKPNHKVVVIGRGKHKPFVAETFGAYDDSISERQEWLIGELGGKVDKSMNRSKASDYIKELQGKKSGTWKGAEAVEAETFEATGISDFTVMFMLGYLDQATFVDAVRNNDISASELKRYVNKLNNAFGGYEGLLQYFNLYDTQGEDVANFFANQMKETYKRGGNTYNQYYDFDDDYTKEQFMKDYRTSKMSAEGESKRKGSHTPNLQLVNYEDVLREKRKNQNMKDAETFGVETVERGWIGDNLPPSKEERLSDLKEKLEYLKTIKRQLQMLYNSSMPFTTGLVGHLPRMEKKMSDIVDFVEPQIRHYNQLIDETQEQINRISAETFEANEEAVEQTDANMVNEGSVEAFYGGGAKVSVSSAGIQPTANPSVDEAFNVGNQVGLDVAEQEIMNRNPSVEVNYGGEDMSLRESAKLGFGVGAGLLGFNVALLGIATIGGFLLNRD